MANEEKVAVKGRPNGVEKSVIGAVVEVGESIGRAIDRWRLTPNQELDLYTALMSVLETLALGVINDDEDEQPETIQ